MLVANFKSRVLKLFGNVGALAVKARGINDIAFSLRCSALPYRGYSGTHLIVLLSMTEKTLRREVRSSTYRISGLTRENNLYCRANFHLNHTSIDAFSSLAKKQAAADMGDSPRTLRYVDVCPSSEFKHRQD